MPASSATAARPQLTSTAGQAPSQSCVLSCPSLSPGPGTALGMGEGMALWMGLDRDWVAWAQPGLTTCWLCDLGQIHSPLWTSFALSALWGGEVLSYSC